jgi:hypothetical protein
VRWDNQWQQALRHQLAAVESEASDVTKPQLACVHPQEALALSTAIALLTRAAPHEQRSQAIHEVLCHHAVRKRVR